MMECMLQRQCQFPLLISQDEQRRLITEENRKKKSNETLFQGGTLIWPSKIPASVFPFKNIAQNLNVENITLIFTCKSVFKHLDPFIANVTSSR